VSVSGGGVETPTDVSAHRVQTDFSGMPVEKAKFEAHPPGRHPVRTKKNRSPRGGREAVS
jgi:hypothetical protein